MELHDKKIIIDRIEFFSSKPNKDEVEELRNDNG